MGRPEMTAWHAASGWGLPCILEIGEAVLAANLITGFIFKHLERNVADSSIGPDQGGSGDGRL